MGAKIALQIDFEQKTKTLILFGKKYKRPKRKNIKC
jgi:hypothetical protein